ncbi:cupin domain-containing protein [Variovorax flavidus]|uniref:cupin domain-containing protein n=1 Tax=Variovorax flavidus TaxID=3053501 RepID=UPI0033656218
MLLSFEEHSVSLYGSPRQYWCGILQPWQYLDPKQPSPTARASPPFAGRVTEVWNALDLTLVTLCAALASATSYGQPRSLPESAVTPEELRWIAPPAGLPYALVVGDPTTAGVYVGRGRLEAGLRVEPHSHPDNRVVTVLSGTVLVGYGEVFDENKMKVLPAGSTWTEPANQPHYAWAKDGEVVVQVVGNGPSGTHLVRKR